MPLKLGTTTYQYIWNRSLEDSIKNISAMGFRKIELMVTPPHLWVERLDRRAISKIKKTADALDGDIAGFGEGTVIVTPQFAEIGKSPLSEKTDVEIE